MNDATPNTPDIRQDLEIFSGLTPVIAPPYLHVVTVAVKKAAVPGQSFPVELHQETIYLRRVMILSTGDGRYSVYRFGIRNGEIYLSDQGVHNQAQLSAAFGL